MPASSINQRPHGPEPPLRRVLAVDAGSRCIRLLLMESYFGRLRVLHQIVLDLQQEGLVATEELQAQLQKSLAQWGRPPIALVLPQAVAVAQLVDLPPVPDAEARKLIGDETIKLAGVSESALVYDFVRVPNPEGAGAWGQVPGPDTPRLSPGTHCFWVTFCQEIEIQNRITQLGLDGEEFREITTAANALLTAWLHTISLQSKAQSLVSQVQSPKPALDFRPGTLDGDAVLVHVGAQGTTVVVVRGGTGVFAASFPMGGDFFTRAIARLKKCSNEAAEATKCSSNLLAGAEVLAGFPEIVDGWAAELKRQLAESRYGPQSTVHGLDSGLGTEAGGAGAGPVWVASGGAFAQPGLLEYLRATAGLPLARWPAPQSTVHGPQSRLGTRDSGLGTEAEGGFEVAFGAGLQALGLSPQPVSLLPENRRAVWRQRLGRQRLEFANAVLLWLCFLVLGFGVWRKVALIERKEALLAKVQAGLDTVQANAALTGDLLNSYETLRPVFDRQQGTVDTLESLALLQQARSNGAPWFVLVADQQSYFSHPPTLALAGTNRAAGPALELEVGPRLRESTNPSPARPGLIAEVCIPDSAEGARQTLGLMVSSLKRSPAFARVDLLSEDLRRSLANTNVLIRDRHFALALDFATTEFQTPPPGRRTRAGTPGRPALRSAFPARTTEDAAGSQPSP